jgi:flagellar biosynthesis protein FlhF
VSEAVIDRWLERLEAELACDPESHADRTQERLRHIIAADLPVRGPIGLRTNQTTVIALVGPTGVGKTTTLAKLAAHYHLREKHTVGLITADTYRVAAVEQLQTYSQLMKLPCEVADTPESMSAAIAKLRECDAILIDTPGSSPRDLAALRDLRTLLEAAQPDEIPLVLSCAGEQTEFEATAKTFRRSGATSLILTKIDEAWRVGQLPTWLAACRLPLVYTTRGQGVPDDLTPASALELAELIFPNH